MPALPPPNSVENVCLEVLVDRGERFAESRVRRFVDLADRLVGLRDRVDEILLLGRQEQVALFELLRLLDRHHVDGAHAINLFAQFGDGFFRGHLARVQQVQRRSTGSTGSRRFSALFELVGIDRFSGADGPHVGLHLARGLHLRDLVANVVEASR